MKNKLYFYNLMIFIIILLTKFIFINKYIDYLNIFISISFLVLTLTIYLSFGLPNSNKPLRKISIEITLVVILLYLIITSLSGLVLGYSKNPLSYNFINIFSNIYYLIILVISEEIIRFIIAKKSIRENREFIIATILFIILDMLLYTRNLNNIDSYTFFVLLTTTLIPSTICNLTSAFLSKNISYIPAIILRIFFYIYPYILPIYPNISDYIISLINLFLPFIFYVINLKYISNYERTRLNKSINNKLWYLNIISWAGTFGLIILITGVFKYKLIAIGSGSMETSISFGDAIVFKKFNKDNEYNNLQVGDIVVFEANNDLIVHRVVSIIVSDEDIYVHTKGDSNEKQDPYVLHKKDILGKYVFKIKYLGIPTIFLNELLK